MADPEKAGNPVSQVWDAIKQRLDHQVFGPFVIAWLVYNWDFVAILVAGPQDMVTRVGYLKAQYCWWPMLWPTVVFTFLYVAGSQWIAGAAGWNVEAAKAFWGNLLRWIERRKRSAWIFEQPPSVQHFAQKIAYDEDQLNERIKSIAKREAELGNAETVAKELKMKGEDALREAALMAERDENFLREKVLSFLEDEVLLTNYISALPSKQRMRALSSFRGAVEMLEAKV